MQKIPHIVNGSIVVNIWIIICKTHLFINTTGLIFHFNNFWLLVFHQNEIVICHQGLGQNVDFSYILDNISKISIIFQPLLTFIKNFTFVKLRTFKDSIATKLTILKDKYVLPSYIDCFSLIHWCINNLRSRLIRINTFNTCLLINTIFLIQTNLSLMIKFIYHFSLKF